MLALWHAINQVRLMHERNARAVAAQGSQPGGHPNSPCLCPHQLNVKKPVVLQPIKGNFRFLQIAQKRKESTGKMPRQQVKISFGAHLFHRLSLLLTLADALGEQKLDLAVDRAKVLFSPGGEFFPQCRSQPQQQLFFRLIVFLDHGFQ
jgi:hypothetical protein